MFRNTHASVGQNPGRVLYRAQNQRAERAGSSPTPFCQFPAHELPRPSEFVRPSPRPGISLTEVLIAMGILTVGLLGVASVFPVGSFYMQQGDRADRGSAIAQAAFNNLLTRGMLNPESWFVMVPTSSNQPNTTFNVDLKGNPPALNRGTFTRPFAAAFREALTKGILPLDLARNFGAGYVIDPMGVNAFAAANTNSGTTSRNFIALPFPSSFYAWFTDFVSPTDPWSPWSGRYNSPLRRVTFRDTTTGWQLNPDVADRLFRSTDDLSLDLPTAQDKPSLQMWDVASTDLNGDGNLNDLLARQSRGDYSWLATVMPTNTEAHTALARGLAGHAYEVSVVVFYKRVLPSSLPVSNTEILGIAAQERMAKARIVSTGLSGGEIRIERHNSDIEPESPFQQLKTGQWVMLCGPHPNSTGSRPMFVARWYRVLSIEKEANGLITDQANQRVVTLRGPQWPWQPAVNSSGAPDLDSNQLSNSLCVGIIPGAVAVHAKTVQLEGNSVWNGGVSGLGGAPPPSPFVSR